MTGANVEDVWDDEASMKITAAMFFAEALFDEEIVLDENNGYMFKSETVPEGVC